MITRLPLQVIRESAAVQDKMLEVRRQLCPVWCSSHNNSQSRHVFWRLRSCTSAPQKYIHLIDGVNSIYVVVGCCCVRRRSASRTSGCRWRVGASACGTEHRRWIRHDRHSTTPQGTCTHVHTYILDGYLRSAGAHRVTRGVGLLGSNARVMAGVWRRGLVSWILTVWLMGGCVHGAAGSMSSARRQYELGWNGARRRYGTRVGWEW